MNSVYWALGLSATLSISALTFAFWFGTWYGKVNTNQDNFREFMKEVRSDIKEILTRLPAKSISSTSPIKLTELGERISTAISAKSWAEQTANELVEKTRGMDSFQIQTFSFKHAEELEPDDALLQRMRESAFQEGIDLEGVKDVLGVELRDCLLRLNNLTQSSLEK